MQSPSKRSTSSSPSPERPASPPPTSGNRARSLSRRTLRHAAKQANDGSTSHAGNAASSDQDLHLPIRELITLGSGQGGPAAGDVHESVRPDRSTKIRLRLKRKPVEASSSSSSSSPRSPICLFCLRRFSTRTDLLDHLQTEHSSTEEQVQDQAPDHEQGEENGGGDSGAEKKSEKEEVSSAGLDLNQPIEEVQVSAADDTIGGTRKKFRFDLNEFPPSENAYEN